MVLLWLPVGDDRPYNSRYRRLYCFYIGAYAPLDTSCQLEKSYIGPNYVGPQVIPLGVVHRADISPF